MTEVCTRKLLAALPNAKTSIHVVSPSDVGLQAIGHVGAFRSGARERLWPLMADCV
jgi:predicted alpha/beta hydrolase